MLNVHANFKSPFYNFHLVVGECLIYQVKRSNIAWHIANQADFMHVKVLLLFLQPIIPHPLIQALKKVHTRPKALLLTIYTSYHYYQPEQSQVLTSS